MPLYIFATYRIKIYLYASSSDTASRILCDKHRAGTAIALQLSEVEKRSRTGYSTPARRHIEINQIRQRPHGNNSANKDLTCGQTDDLYCFTKMSDTLLLVTDLFLPHLARSVDWQGQRSCLKALSNIHGLGKH
jgi:hypothetical protein